MLVQSGSVIQILLRRDAGWNPQRRDDGSIPLSDIVRRHRWHTILGLVAGIAAFAIATSLFLWMSPTILGLVLAIPISWASGQLFLGLALKRAGLLMTPEEREPPAIATAARAIEERNAALAYDDADGLRALHADPDLQAGHLAFLPPAERRPRGEPQPDHVMAQAKVVEAETIDEAAEWLNAKEKMVLLHDRALLDRLARLDG